MSVIAKLDPAPLFVDIKHEDIKVVRLTPAKKKRAVDAVLKDLGLTRGQLREQARTRQFSSTRARQLWMATGGSI